MKKWKLTKTIVFTMFSAHIASMFGSIFHSESIQKAVRNPTSHFETEKTEKVHKMSPKRSPMGTPNPLKINKKTTSDPQTSTPGSKGRPGSPKWAPRPPKWSPRTPKIEMFGSKSNPIYQSVSQRLNASTNQRINDSTTQRINESVNQWSNESLNQWINDSMNRWIQESMNS